MTFRSQLNSLYGTEDLYTVLNVNREATENEIKKAYHRRSLLVHPDKCEDSDKKLATEKFQCLSKVYNILSDKDKKLQYDKTGELDMEDDNMDWLNIWKTLFKPIEEQDIVNFIKQYKGSEEELEDLKRAYLSSKGKLNLVFNMVMCCNVLDDEERFSQIIHGWIDKGEVPDYEAFSQETDESRAARRKKAEKEAKIAAKMMKKYKEEQNAQAADDNLVRAISARNQARGESFLEQMERKYGNLQESDESWEEEGKKGGKGRRATSKQGAKGRQSTRNQDATNGRSSTKRNKPTAAKKTTSEKRSKSSSDEAGSSTSPQKKAPPAKKSKRETNGSTKKTARKGRK